MRQNTRRIGDAYENRACQMLQAGGLDIITRNYHASKLGEIDIIAQECKTNRFGQMVRTIIFVEVRARRHRHQPFVSSVQSITIAKQRKIIQAAEYFLQHHESFAGYDCRFDVIVFDEFGERATGEWIKSAFLAE